MFRHEFDALWSEPDKCVTEEIIFRLGSGYGPVYSFDDIPVICQSGIDLRLHGYYSCLTSAITFNFTIPGIGPVNRYCAGGPEHLNAGRFHRHLMTHESDPRQNLPHAEARPMLEGLSTIGIWRLICSEGQIEHTERFYEPEDLCE